MKKEILFFLLILISILIQTTLFFPFNFPLFILFFLLFFLPKKTSFFISIFTGFLLDLLSEKPFYFYTLLSILIFLFVQFLIKKHVKV